LKNISHQDTKIHLLHLQPLDSDLYGEIMKIIKIYLILLTFLLITCASKEVVKNNITVHFKSLANDFAAVDMSLYDNNKFEIKTATLEMHGNEEFLLEIEGIWNIYSEAGKTRKADLRYYRILKLNFQSKKNS